MTDRDVVDNDEIDVEARKLASAFHALIMQEYREQSGLHELAKDLRWARTYRQMLEKFGTIVASNIITVTVVGLSLAVWEGLKFYLSR
jgi:hypothetical protein